MLAMKAKQEGRESARQAGGAAMHFRRSYRGPLRAVVLDWAGTTVDFGSFAPIMALERVLAARGVHPTDKQIRLPMGRAKREHMRAILAQPGVEEAWAALHGPLTEEALDEMYEEFLPAQLAELENHSALVPGTLEAVAEFRRRGMFIGTTTGYDHAMMGPLQRLAAVQGFEPDHCACVSPGREGRPMPWMCFEIAERAGVFPMEAFVKIGDTPVDVEEGLNAGMWTIALSETGNEMGLSPEELDALPAAERASRRDAAAARLAAAGAHYVVAGIGEVAPLLAQIEARLRAGEKP